MGIKHQTTMSKIRRLFLKLFPRYRILERRFVNYGEGDRLIRETHALPNEADRWELDTEREDHNRIPFMVYLCRRERIMH